MKTEKWLVPAIVLLSISIAFSGFFISKTVLALIESNNQAVIEQKSNEDILSFSETAVYLKISEDRLKSIVDNSDIIDGKGIPYYRIDNSIMFSKTALSKWIVHSSENRLDY